MKTFSLEISLDMEKLAVAERTFFESVGMVGVFETLLTQGLSGLYSQGLPLVKGKTLARLQKRIDKAGVSSKALVVEDAEFDLIKEAFCGENAKFAPQQYRVVAALSENIENATDPAAPKAV